MSGTEKASSSSREPPKAKNLHANHRKRMLQQYLSSRGAQMLPHQLLELLLFYCIPRRDTNPLAHRLLDRFTSIPNLLEQSEEALCSVEGFGPASARLLRCVGAIRAYLRETVKVSHTRFTVEWVMAQLDQVLPNPPAAGLLLVLVDGRGDLFPPIVVTTKSLAGFTVSDLKPLAQRMVDAILACCKLEQVSAFVLVEVGTQGAPQVEQIYVARTLRRALLFYDVRLWDYITRTPERDYSFVRLSLLT